MVVLGDEWRAKPFIHSRMIDPHLNVAWPERCCTPIALATGSHNSGTGMILPDKNAAVLSLVPFSNALVKRKRFRRNEACTTANFQATLAVYHAA